MNGHPLPFSYQIVYTRRRGSMGVRGPAFGLLLLLFCPAQEK